MVAKLTNPEVAAGDSERAPSVEPVFGTANAKRGMRVFLVRGLNRVSDDRRFQILVTNIQKLEGLPLATPIPAEHGVT